MYILSGNISNSLDIPFLTGSSLGILDITIYIYISHKFSQALLNAFIPGDVFIRVAFISTAYEVYRWQGILNMCGRLKRNFYNALLGVGKHVVCLDQPFHIDEAFHFHTSHQMAILSGWEAQCRTALLLFDQRRRICSLNYRIC